MAFYTRTITIDGVTYKQISIDSWKNLFTGETIDNTRMATIINEFKGRQFEQLPVSGGTAGACCVVINGVLTCSEKIEGECANGCFKGAGVTCSGVNPCESCVYCCTLSQGCTAKNAAGCLQIGGTYFASNGCTACKYGVCSTDPITTQRFYGNGCTGVFIEGGSTGSFDLGVFCTGSGFGQTCFASGMRYQNLSPNFIGGGTCSDCIYGSCCTGGTCAGIMSQSACSILSGLFFAGQTCSQCNFGVFCQGATTNRTCIRTGYRGEALSEQFQAGATCAYCITGTCCVNGTVSFGDTVRQTTCQGIFFPNRFAGDACATGSCCLANSCDENVYRYNCDGVFNAGATCLACSSGACCLTSGCTLTTLTNCSNLGGTFFGGATCLACDTGVCCNNGQCTDQRRGNICAGTFYAGTNCSSTPCEKGACCLTGGTCLENSDSINCSNLGGYFAAGFTCIGCATGANCTEEILENNDRACSSNVYFADVSNGTFYQNQGCSACEYGACCNVSGGGTEIIRGDCTGTSVFYKGQTLRICDTGVFCTGSQTGQTCFGLGYRGQSLTNNFIAGATCNACILGSCCTGGTCLGGGLTSQAVCNSAGGLFYAGATCRSCEYGVYCSGTTCFGLGYRGQSLTNNFIVGATCSSCILGACCTGGTCQGGTLTSQATCSSLGGLFYAGATCRSCEYGVYCTGATCSQLGYRGQSLTNNFIAGATCSSCILGACCTGGTCFGNGQTSQAACIVAGGNFYAGATCFQCTTGVFCTGSGLGQTCFGLGHRGQSLTNNFIAGATCSSCILGACCTGGTCYGGTLTSQATCASIGGLFYAGATCDSCVYGVYCTGSNETTSCIGLGYKAQNLSNQFIISGSCANDCLYGACCQGTTCLGITSQGNCPKPYSFFFGSTCAACDTGTGACCTGGSSSITNISGCNALGGIFFPEGTTALCITGSCCTGGTCTQELTGRSANCQLFIAGATCNICDSGVYCTGSTCFGLGFRGQSLTSNFIQGATCSSCILGICCTGGTCISGGITSQANCPAGSGYFVAGATQCKACQVNVNCCVGGTHSYILKETCISQGGVVFEGTEDSLVCVSGAFCDGITCAGVTLFGFNLGPTFILNGDCGDCIYGNCCGEDYELSYVTENECKGNFYPGEYDENACLQGVTFGICCTGITCTSDVEQSECTGYFIDNQTAAQNSLSCGSNACEMGVCCGETQVTSVTGGVCLGLMTRAECALTGGDFFSTSSGATCSNCLYIPMFTSALFERFAANLPSKTVPSQRTSIFFGSETGLTGNEIQPIKDGVGNGDNWIDKDVNLHSVGGTFNAAIYRRNNVGGSQVLQQPNRNFSPSTGTLFTLWYNSGVTLHTPTNSPGGATYGVFDPPPEGVTSAIGTTLGFIISANGSTVYQVPRYLKLTFGYGNPSDYWHGQEIVYRWFGNNSFSNWALNDATKQAGLSPLLHNIFPNPTPFASDTSTIPSVDYSSPVLVQIFPENPLSHRVRPLGSCCKGITCLGILTKDHCEFTGGTFNENGRCSRCSPNLLFGNCCLNGTNAGYTSLSACNAISGTFFEGTTYNAETCLYGTICTQDRQCYQGVSFSYYGAFSSTNNKFFIEQEYGSSAGCLACDAGLCCVGSTCMGKISKLNCDSLGGTIYYDESTCETNCDLGVCCSVTTSECGTYTNRANCYGVNQVFFAGATQGATCSACSSLLRLTSNSSGVTFTTVLNKGTTYGTFYDGTHWVQETNDLRVLKVRLQYPNANASKTYTYSGNTRITGLTLTPAGYKGSVYIHGSIRNPVPNEYIDINQGITLTKQAFLSINLANYDEGWRGPYIPNATDTASNYPDFDLTQFVYEMNTSKYYGRTLVAGDVLVSNASNFDIDNVKFPPNGGGYPYQVQGGRANTLAYGIVNCLSATAANLAGSTLCLRPPITWPTEDRLNKPIYPVSRMNARVPGTNGITLIGMTTTINADKNTAFNANTAKSPTQFSEFGSGTDYGQITPMWAMAGPRVAVSSYGEQFISLMHPLLESIHGVGTPGSSLTFEQRRDGMARLAQYGLDAFGAHKIYSLNISSGAGQKAGRTRPFIPIAGYFIGETAMYDPEATMLQDTTRLNYLLNSAYTNNNTCLPGPDPGFTCGTEAQWNRFRYGDTGPENNYAGIRRFLGRRMSHEVNTMVEFVNDPSNLLRHYEYVGALYKNTLISGFSASGATGITFYNQLGRTLSTFTKTTYYGDFGVIRWGSGTGAPNPYPNRFDYSTKEGNGGAFQTMSLRVESGPGSSGPSGATASRFYRILHSTGFRSDGTPDLTDPAGGYQIVIGQTWIDGIPDHTSVIRIYPLTPFDAGITRPSSFHPLGYTFTPVAFFIENKPLPCGCGDKSKSILYDATVATETSYFTVSLDAWASEYLFADYVTKTRGVTIISDIAPMADYLKQFVVTSPYNIQSLNAFYSGTNSVFNRWLGITWNNVTEQKSRINFARDYPGVRRYKGATV